MASSKPKSMMDTRKNSHNPSIVSPSSPTKSENTSPKKTYQPTEVPLLPPDHPRSRLHLQEESKARINTRSSPRKKIEVFEDDHNGISFHKKSKSSVSLRSLIGNEKPKTPKPSMIKQENKKPKKSKSSTSLSALISRPKSSKGPKREDSSEPKEKENLTPPTTGEVAPPPIWAQFASHPTEGHLNTRKVPLNDVDLEDEVALYTPWNYSPSKQRNFGDYEQPTLSHRTQTRPRPTSALLPSAPSQTSFTATLSRLRKRSVDQERDQHAVERTANQDPQRESRRSSVETTWVGQSGLEQQGHHYEPTLNKAKRGSKVMAAVAELDGRAREIRIPAPPPKEAEKKLDQGAIDAAFENLLDSRNIPQNVRAKMRSLDKRIKADFIRKETSPPSSASSVDCLALQFSRASETQRPKSGHGSKTGDTVELSNQETSAVVPNVETPRKSRPRSLTFTRSKGDANAKKERPVSHARTKSSDAASHGSLSSLTPSGSFQSLRSLGRMPKAASPEDFISYLRKAPQPQSVEVGRLQKLRQVLRNETVIWVDAFLEKGGMIEVVELLYRIINVEWREEHEDSLLHEVLLCLKALCTTSSALQQLPNIQSRLFPTLLGMLFDKEKKGPSEFTTRGIIIGLLFTYLSACPSGAISTRSRSILSYLQDPIKPDEAQPPGFITTIYQPRPYRMWCNEIVSITKEVFWIFIHTANVIPYPSESEGASTYKERHFPGERPPVPAAPYIGGVEWDATNYLAAHMDLLNGLIASLPTRDERQKLRQHLRDSGFEKCMGISLRTCKEKFYGAIHTTLSTWIGAAKEDGWEIRLVKEGPTRDELPKTPSPKKKKHEEPAPKLDMPKLDLGVGIGAKTTNDDGWL